MSHEIEYAMIGSGEKAWWMQGPKSAWSDLGVLVNEAQNSQEAMRLARLDSNYTKQPTFFQHPDGTFHPCEDRYSVVRDRDNKFMDIVGSTYEILQPSEAFEFMDSLTGEGVLFDTAGSLFGGKVIWLNALMPEGLEVAGDKINPYIIVTTSYDGSTPTTVFPTPTRVVCQNTLRIAFGGCQQRWTVKHTKDQTRQLEAAAQLLRGHNNYNKQMKAVAEDLLKVRITEERYRGLIDALLPLPEEMTKVTRTRQEETRAKVFKAFTAADLENIRATGWGFVNAIADVVCHSEAQRKTDTWKDGRFMDILKDTALTNPTTGQPLLKHAVDLVLAYN